MIDESQPGQPDARGQGTAVTSKICGNRAGVAKKTTIIPVVFDKLSTLSYTNIWKEVLRDIRRRQAANPSSARPGKTVVNFAIEDLQFPYLVLGIKGVLKQIMAFDVIIVVAAESGAVTNNSPALSHDPSRWASSDFPIIVVSSVDESFRMSTFSQFSDRISAWAIGENNIAALHSDNTEYTMTTGTSYGKFSMLKSVQA